MQRSVKFIFILAFGFLAIILGVNVAFAHFLLFAFLCYLLAYRIKMKRFYILLFVLTALIRMAYIFFVNTPPESDFKLLFDAAVNYSQGNYSFSQARYFTDWAYQTGFVIYEGTVIKLVGMESAQMALQLLNALFSSATCLLVYFISRSFVSENASRFSALLCMGAIFPITFVTVLSNQQLATFLFLLGVFLCTGKPFERLHGAIRGLLAGLSIAIGSIIRPEGLIVLSALLLYYLISLIRLGKEVLEIFSS